MKISIKELKEILKFAQNNCKGDNLFIEINSSRTGIGEVITVSIDIDDSTKIVKDVTDYNNW